MTFKDHLYVILAEESSEIVQATCKCLRFGEQDGYPNSNRTNLGDILHKTNDLLAVLELLTEEGIDTSSLFNRVHIERKKQAVMDFMNHSKRNNRLDKDQ